MISKINNWKDTETNIEIIEVASDFIYHPDRHISNGEIKFQNNMIGETSFLFNVKEKYLLIAKFKINEEYENQGFTGRYLKYLYPEAKKFGCKEIRAITNEITCNKLIGFGWQKIEDINENFILVKISI